MYFCQHFKIDEVVKWSNVTFSHGDSKFRIFALTVVKIMVKVVKYMAVIIENVILLVKVVKKKM